MTPELILAADLSKRKKEISVSFNLDKKNKILEKNTKKINKLEYDVIEDIKGKTAHGKIPVRASTTTSNCQQLPTNH